MAVGGEFHREIGIGPELGESILDWCSRQWQTKFRVELENGETTFGRGVLGGLGEKPTEAALLQSVMGRDTTCFLRIRCAEG